MRSPVVWAVLCAATLSPAIAARSDHSDARPERLRLRLEEIQRTAHIPGLSFAVVENGRVLAAEGLGVQSVASGRPATADTLYDIASVSKVIAGVVALRLVELGRLDLDRHMTEFRGFREFCEGFRRQPLIFARDYNCHTEPLTLRHHLAHLVNGRAGDRFFYNPVAFSWTSRPMRDVGGAPYSELVRRYVFEPAGMTRSVRTHRDLPVPQRLASDLAPPHTVDEQGRIVLAPPLEPQGDGAAGGVVSSVLDLAKFDIALDGGRLIADASRDRMFTPARMAGGGTAPYGVGIYVQEHQGHRLVWHSGWWEKAYSALYLKVPERRLTLIALANSEGLWWGNPLDEAHIERAPIAQAFLETFAGSAGTDAARDPAYVTDSPDAARDPAYATDSPADVTGRPAHGI